ncbi:MAG: glycosyl hydrolase 53 family protein [Deltaproteobacteria bacterium]|nr:glycosyl hydrolase 53 family protein [Deltaproteobacteria bacterium]
MCDTWADPGKQIIPAPWRGVSSIDELADLVLCMPIPRM